MRVLAAAALSAAVLAPTAAHAAPAAVTPATYTVRAGDTLGAIAARFGTTVARLVALNHLANANVIRVGQRLQITGSTPAPSPKPAPKPAPATPSPYAPGTKITAATAQQVLVARRTSGKNYGAYARYEWRGAAKGWVRVGTSPARFGWGGLKPGSQRVAGDGSTPIGTYPMVSAFGVGNPGTKMPYRTVTNCSWWSDEAATFNRFVERCGVRLKGEHLADYTTNRVGQYRQTAVIGFNYFGRQIRTGKGSGSAIFLHYAVGYTQGCVGLTSRPEMDATVRWLDPAKKPTIVIAG